MSPPEITVDELRRLRASGRAVIVVDVRDAAEFATAHVDGAVHIPGAELEARLRELRRADLVVTACGKGGGRSLAAASWLRERGVEARLLQGGTFAWLEATWPSEGGER